MADLKITALPALAEADVASADVVPVADISASETKKVTVKDFVQQGVDLIDAGSIPAAKLAAITPSSLGTSSAAKEFIAGPTAAGGAYGSRVIVSGDLPVATSTALGAAAAGTGLSVTSGTFAVAAATSSVVGGLSVPTASGLSVNGSGVVSHQSSVTAQTKNGLTVNASGHITAVGSIPAGDVPIATTSAVGGVFIGSGLSVTAPGQLNHTDSVTAGTTSGITFNSTGHITGTAALVASDLPVATTTAKGATSIPAGALSVSGTGALTHDVSGVTAGTYPKVTVDVRGHVTTGTTLVAADIPEISAAKLTSGTIGTSLIANDAVTGGKLANGSVTRFAGAPNTNGVVSFGTADFDGQLLYDSTNENLYIFDGNAFKSIDIVSGEIVFSGTYDASTNLVASVTAKGTAIGLTVGQALIAPASSNLNHYLAVSKSGTGSGNAPAEALAPPDFLLSTGTEWEVLDLSTALAATSASNVSYAATGGIVATDVQAAIEELDTEKASLVGPTFTGATTFSGNVNLGVASQLVFEGSAADDHETTFAITNPTADRTITFPNVTGTIITTGDTGTVTNAMLAGSIALAKLANLTSGRLIVGNGSNVPIEVAMSGDATLSNTGAVTIANDAVTAAKLADTSVTAASYSNTNITVDAQGRITAASNGSAAGIADIKADTSPQLGGDLDVDGKDIISASNGNIELDPNGSGQVIFKGNATRGSGTVKLNCEQNTHGILLKGPPHSAAASYTLTLPNDTGTSTQVLETNGSGVTSWATPVKLGAAQSFTKAQRGTPVALTDAASVAVDLSLGNNFTLTLAGNRTLAAPTNVTAGQSGVIIVTQDGTGSRTLAYNSVFKFAAAAAPTLTTTASAVDVLAYYVESATRISVTSLLNLS